MNIKAQNSTIINWKLSTKVTFSYPTPLRNKRTTKKKHKSCVGNVISRFFYYLFQEFCFSSIYTIFSYSTTKQQNNKKKRSPQKKVDKKLNFYDFSLFFFIIFFVFFITLIIKCNKITSTRIVLEF